MINKELLNPRSIVVVGGSDDVSKPGGKILANLLSSAFTGDLYVLNPKSDKVQGVNSFRDMKDIPPVDLAIIAVAAKYCVPTVEYLVKNKATKAFIIVSAGFGEENEAGRELENELIKVVKDAGATLIGPNCIGFMNSNYYGVFTEPLPEMDPKGIDFISGSGATAVFIMETGMKQGLSFASVWSVGNAATTGVEDVLEHMDNEYVPGESPNIKLLYIENIADPQRLLKHSRSLISKGCRIAALKAGRTEAGSRAASSHTGALSSPDTAVDALFRKAGIVRCFSRNELANVAAVFRQGKPKGRNIAVVTHAGGPAVMITDSLSEYGFRIPDLHGTAAEKLLDVLFPGSSIANPIDILATGTAEQVGQIMDTVENELDGIDAMVVIHGSPGLGPVDDVYDMIDSKIRSCKKPVYPILPSVINAEKESISFMKKGNVFFPDEVNFARAFALVNNTLPPAVDSDMERGAAWAGKESSGNIRKLMEKAGNVDGYLESGLQGELLDAAGIPRVREIVAKTEGEALDAAGELGWPLVMKVVGPVHKSDVGGVLLGIDSEVALKEGVSKLMDIDDATAVLLQPMSSGTELFAGVKKEEGFGHVIMFGLGGIMIEVIKDVSTALAPVSREEAVRMIRNLKGYPVIKGTRGQEGVNEDALVDVVLGLSRLVTSVPEIEELDLNPLFGTPEGVIAVDARIRIVK